MLARRPRPLFAPLSSLLLVTAAACTAEPPPAPTHPVASVAASVPQNDAPALDMSPVPAPKSVVLRLRARSPKETIDKISQLAKLPGGAIESELERASDGVARHFDLNEPFDLAIALDPATADLDHPRFFFGFSLPMGPDHQAFLDRVQKEGDEVREAGPGMYRLRSRDLHCELYAPGDRPSRLVCAEGIAALRELGPWMARTLPFEKPAARDLSLQLYAGPLQEKLLPFLETKLDKGMKELRSELGQVGVQDSELLDAPATLQREVMAMLAEPDIAALSFGIDASKKELALDFELTFRSGESWSSKLFTSAKPTPAPDAFFRLPATAETALFQVAGDPQLFAPIRRVARKGAAAALDFAPLAAADKGAILGLLDALPVARGTLVYAGGSVAEAKPWAGKPEAFAPKDAVDAARARISQAVGWSLMGGEGDGRDIVELFKRATDVYARMHKVEVERADQALKAATKDDKEWRKRRRQELDHWPTVKTVADPAGYPKGSTAFNVDIELESEDVWSMAHPLHEWDARPKHPKAGAKGHVVLGFVVAPDSDGRYWLGWSADAGALKEKVQDALSSGKRERQLASSRDLSAFKAPLRAGGFISPGAFLRSFAKLDESDHDFRELLALFAKLPNLGAGSIQLTAGGASGDRPSVQIRLSSDRRFTEDMAAALSEEIARELKRR